MKNSVQPPFSVFFRSASKSVVALLAFTLLGRDAAFAAAVQEARVTRIVKDVQVVGGTSARPAALSDQVRPGNGVRTGTESRAELTFNDLSITRLGANTVFSFNGNGRSVDLGGGAVLVEAPPNSPAINVNTAAFSAAISGGTGLIEFHLGGVSKILILEGQGGVTNKDGSGGLMVVNAGQMITLSPDGKWSSPQKFSVAQVMKTSNLVTDFGSLPNAQLIFDVIAQQQNDFGGGTVTNQPPHDNTLDATVDRNTAAPPGGGPTPGPTPPGIPVIRSPDPYVITSGTTITTDPTITTNGQTDQGLLYRGAALDGPVSAAAFGSTSGFDVASGFDQVIKGENPAAAFKFLDLQITGNPSVDITNGPDALALIAINGITSGGPGGNISFANARGILLAAQNGSVTLGSEVSFSGMHDITIYARGDSSDLTLGSNLSPDEHANLFAQRDMSINSTVNTGQVYFFSGRDLAIHGVDTVQANTMIVSALGNLSWDGETSSAPADHGTGEVDIQAAGNISFANDLSITRQSSQSDGLNLTLTSGGNTTIGGNLSYVIDNSNGGSIATGGNISINAGGNLTVNGSSGINLSVLNNLGGNIDSGGNITVAVNGNLNTSFFNGLINTRDNGTIGSSVAASVSVNGAFNTTFGSGLAVSDRFDTTAGGTIHGDASVNVTAGSVSVSDPSGSSVWAVSNNDGGHITGDATVSVNITGNAAVGSVGNFEILNLHHSGSNIGMIDGHAVIDFSCANLSANSPGGFLQFLIANEAGVQSPSGGQIGGNAGINLTTAAISTNGSDFSVIIDNGLGGIGGSAGIGLNATGAVNIGGSALVQITNANGSIGADASIAASMTSLSTLNAVTFSIGNNFGFIGGSASVYVLVNGPGGVTLPNFATFEIDNTGFVGSIQPHEALIGITGDASLTLNVSSGGLMDDDGLEVDIKNRGNRIGGKATLSANVANTLQINAGDARFEILNANGSIGGNASVSATAGNLSAKNIFAQIDNSYGTINGAASVSINVAGDVTTSDVNGVQLYLLNEGGSIGSGGDGHEVSYTAGGTTTTDVLQTFIDNSFGGVIATGGNQFVHTTGPVVLNGPFGMELDNYNGGSITSGGNLTAHFEGDVTDTPGNFHSVNFNILNGSGFFTPDASGGTIVTGGNIDATFDGSVTTSGTATQGSFSAQIQNGNGGSITTGGNLTVNIAGNLSSGPLFVITDNTGGGIGTGGNITFHVTGSVTSQGQAVFELLNHGGTIGGIPAIDVHAASFSTGKAFIAYIDNEGGAIGPGGTGQGVVSITSDGDVTVGLGLFVFGSLNSGGTISASKIASTDLTATTAINAGSGGIHQFSYVTGSGDIPLVIHTLTAPSITSAGGINFNGPDASESTAGQDGGTLILNPASISFGPTGDIQGSVTLNGGAGLGSEPPGNGGSLTVNASGDVTVNTDIEATTGYQDASASPQGVGGNVTLKSTGGLVTVNNRIEVSSDDPTPSQTPPPPIRRSNSGGTILLQSNLTAGQGITIGANARLLSLLNASATGAGGSITLSTMGSNITISPGAVIEADRGTITIDQNDPPNQVPTITINGAILTSDSLVINGAGDVSIGMITGNAATYAVVLASGVTINANSISVTALGLLDFVQGNLSTGDLNLAINNPAGGTIHTDAGITLDASSVSTSNGVSAIINNAGATIQGSAAVDLSIFGSLTAQGVIGAESIPNSLHVSIDNTDGGNITGDATVSVTAASLSTGSRLQESIDNFANLTSLGGKIGGKAAVSLTVTGNLTTATEDFHIFNGDTIGSAASISVNAGNISTFANTVTGSLGLFNEFIGNTGEIGGSASISLGLTGSLTTDSASVDLGISNGYASSNTIKADATITADAVNISSARFVVIDIGNSAGFSATNPQTLVGTGGTILGKAAITLNLSGDLTASQHEISISIGNFGGGSIGSDASISLSAANASAAAGSFYEGIDNSNAGFPVSGGIIGGNALVTLNLSNTLTTQNLAQCLILNMGGTINTDAMINVTAASMSVGSLVANINNTGGSIGGNADVTMNVSGDATVTGDANVEIIGNDPTGSAAININGGNYTVGGQFYSTIDGSGTLTFNGTNIHADTVKAAVFGTNGSLIVGGGSLNADTVLRLYAPGSSGVLQFVSNVTLSSGTVMDLAANTITINHGVTVAIEGAGGAANIFTNHPNYNFTPGGTYTGPAGNPNGGSFGGTNGANDPQPLASAPTFNDTVAPPSASRSTATRSTTASSVRVNNSGQVLSMINSATPDSAGRVSVAPSNRTNGSQASRRLNANRTVTQGRSDIKSTMTNATAPKIQ